MKIKLIDEKGKVIKNDLFKKICEVTGFEEYDLEYLILNGCNITTQSMPLTFEEIIEIGMQVIKFHETTPIMGECDTCEGLGRYNIIRGDVYIGTYTCEDCKGTGEVELN